MHIILLLILLQVKQHPPMDITTPQAPSVQPLKRQTAPNLSTPVESSTPAMTPETAVQLQMEHEIGGQGVELGMLKEKVGGLEQTRNQVDRPDIESLKSSRLYFRWGFSFLVIGFGIIAYFRQFLWRASLPWLREELRGNRHPPTAERLDIERL